LENTRGVIFVIDFVKAIRNLLC